MRAAAHAAGLFFVVAIAGCSSSDRVGDAEEGIAAVLGERLGSDGGAVTVTCPDDADLDAGATVTCDVTVEGSEALAVPFEIGDDGSVRLAAAVLPSPAVERHLVTELAAAAEGDVAVDCGEAPLLVRDVGGTFPCDVVRAADGVGFVVEVQVRSLDGSITYTVASTTTTTTTTATTVPAVPAPPP